MRRGILHERNTSAIRLEESPIVCPCPSSHGSRVTGYSEMIPLGRLVGLPDMCPADLGRVRKTDGALLNPEKECPIGGIEDETGKSFLVSTQPTAASNSV